MLSYPVQACAVAAPRSQCDSQPSAAAGVSRWLTRTGGIQNGATRALFESASRRQFEQQRRFTSAKMRYVQPGTHVRGTVWNPLWVFDVVWLSGTLVKPCTRYVDLYVCAIRRRNPATSHKLPGARLINPTHTVATCFRRSNFQGEK